jgi:predicted nucleotidyltransferase component of viral defense system
MLSLSSIVWYYPQNQSHNKEMCLKEYLQMKILKSIFWSPYGTKLRFIGGTALRIVYQNQRFSEDLDFDIVNLSFDDFENLATIVRHDLEAEWLTVMGKTIKKWAFHCHISIPEILYENQLAPMKNQTILIQIDAHAQWYSYEPKQIVLNTFDIVAPILTCTKELLLAHKLFACFTRKRLKGRDFFDIVFLLGLTRSPDFGYLKAKMNIETPWQLKEYLTYHCQWKDFHALHRDVSPFLFDPSNQSVLLFPQIIDQTTFL